MAELTAKQRLFVAYYLGESAGNATDAARRAGYLSPEQQGPQLLRKTRVRAAVNAKLDHASLTADEILARLSEQATTDVSDFIEIDEQGHYSIALLKAKRLRKLGLIKRIKPSQWGTEIQFHDPQKALELLGRYRGLWKDAQEPPPQKIIVEYYDRPIDPEGDVSEAASESDQGQD